MYIIVWKRNTLAINSYRNERKIPFSVFCTEDPRLFSPNPSLQFCNELRISNQEFSWNSSVWLIFHLGDPFLTRFFTTITSSYRIQYSKGCLPQTQNRLSPICEQHINNKRGISKSSLPSLLFQKYLFHWRKWLEMTLYSAARQELWGSNCLVLPRISVPAWEQQSFQTSWYFFSSWYLIFSLSDF